MLENKLAWAPGSIDTILTGGEPTETVPNLPRPNLNAPSQGYALHPTIPNAVPRLHRGIAAGARRRIIAPRTTPRHLGRLGRPDPHGDWPEQGT